MTRALSATASELVTEHQTVKGWVSSFSAAMYYIYLCLEDQPTMASYLVHQLEKKTNIATQSLNGKHQPVKARNILTNNSRRNFQQNR